MMQFSILVNIKSYRVFIIFKTIDQVIQIINIGCFIQ